MFVTRTCFRDVTRATIKAGMSLNFGHTQPLTAELAAIDLSTFSRLLLIRSFLNLQIMISWICLNFGQFGPQTTELAAPEHLKYHHRLIMEKMVPRLFSYLRSIKKMMN